MIQDFRTAALSDFGFFLDILTFLAYDSMKYVLQTCKILN